MVASSLGALFAIGVGGVGTSSLDQEVNDFDSVKVKFNLWDGDTISFKLPAGSPAAPYLSGLASDVFLYNRLDTTRTDHLWQRFRVMPMEQDWDGDGVSDVTVEAVCYKQCLKGRVIHGAAAGHPYIFPFVDEATIVSELVAHTQAQASYFDLGIITATGVTATGQSRQRTEYKPGDNIYKLIDDLSQVINGPVTQVKPTATQTRQLLVRKLSTFTTWQMPLVWGDNATKMKRQPGTFANAAFVPPTTGLSWGYYLMPSASTDARGVWEVSVSASSSVIDQTTLDSLAQGAATEMSQQPANWQVTLDVDRWMTDSRFMPGDLVSVKVPGPIVDLVYPEGATMVTARVIEVELTVDNTGAADVKMSLEEQ